MVHVLILWIYLTTRKHGGPWRNLCAALLKNPYSREMVTTLVRKQIRKGDSTLPWHDLWLGDCTLKILCPRLFQLSTLPNSKISSFGFWNGRDWEWIFSWSIDLRRQDLMKWNNLNCILSQLNFNVEAPHSFIWSHEIFSHVN